MSEYRLNRVGAIVENAVPKRIFSTGVSMSPMLRVKAACNRGVITYTASWKMTLHGDDNTILMVA
jgi:hypothetical protein